MTATVRYADVEVGTELPEQTYPVRRLDLSATPARPVTSTRSTGTSGSPRAWAFRT